MSMVERESSGGTKGKKNFLIKTNGTNVLV